MTWSQPPDSTACGVVEVRAAPGGLKRKNDAAAIRPAGDPRVKRACPTVMLPETYRRRSAPPDISAASPRPSRRTASSSSSGGGGSGVLAPRWHSQAYLLFLALRQHPAKCLPRTDLIRAALELDRKISSERNLPRLFRGKTPMNSASAILTNNIDRYFIPFRPEGSRCLHFRLAHDPGNHSDAVRVYKRWEARLVRDGWPVYFGRRSSGVRGHPPLPPQAAATTEFDAFIMARRRQDADGDRAAEEQTEPAEDMGTVPRSWRELVQVVRDGEHDKVVAVRELPAETPLGFYFGVPMTKDEFESLKDGVGEASERCVLYRKTVLDATDQRGELSREHVLCPFHFMRETADAGCANVVLLEGAVLNQVICWTGRRIARGEELMLLDRRQSHAA